MNYLKEKRLSLKQLRTLASIRVARLREENPIFDEDEFDDMPLMHGLFERYRQTGDIKEALALLFRHDVYAELYEEFLPTAEHCGDGQIPFLDCAFKKAASPAKQLEIFRYLWVDLAIVEKDADIRKDIKIVALKVFGAIEFPPGSYREKKKDELFKKLSTLQPKNVEAILEDTETLDELIAFLNLP